ncbi:DNA double-strand break repair helicase HerA [uncultured archaeon]|nr:DNA double-strand break repair helicase HerA [uncultured archaeon]
MREQLGTVVSSMEGPSPSSVDFVVNEGKAHKGMFAELEYSEGTMMLLVEDVIKTNRYFERPDSVKVIGAELEKNFPAAEWEFLIAKAKPLGVFTENGIQRTTFPPSPGSKVFLADNERIKKFLNLQTDGLNLGRLQFHDVELKVNLSRLLQKHLAIVATSGAGKSYFISVLLEELLSRKKEQGQIGVVVIDTHGEYTCFGEPIKQSESKTFQDFSSKTKIIDGSKIRIACSKVHIGMISQIVELSPNQRRELSKIFHKLNDEMRSGAGPFDLNAVRAEIENVDNEKTAASLHGVVSELEDLNLFGKIDEPGIIDFVKPGQLLVIDLNSLTSEKKKQVIVAYLSGKLFHERRSPSKKIPPFALFVEEAHNFIPEGTAAEHAVARSSLRTIAREGRKFGASLVVISQRPKRLDTTTLANCNTNIILRVTNPYDLKHIAESCEGIDSSTERAISSLRVGEAIVVGEAVGSPTFFKVRLRKSQPSRHETTLEDSARAFALGEEKKDEEVNSFL